MVVRPCLGCQRPTRNGSRCPSCAQAYERRRNQRNDARRGQGNTTARGYGARWQAISRQVIAARPWCSDCGHTGGGENPLTVDHVVSKARGGGDDPSNLRVLCRACNSRKGSGRTSGPAPARRWTPEPLSPAFMRRFRSMARLAQSSVIHVCGAPGSGKSYLSALLADRLHVPALSIDAERVKLLRPGESWPANDALAWCALEDRIEAAGRAVVETSGLHGNDVILFGGRRVLRLLCRAAPAVRQQRLADRALSGYPLVGDQADYVARLMRIPEPTVPADLTIDTTHGVTDETVADLAARALAFLDGGRGVQISSVGVAP